MGPQKITEVKENEQRAANQDRTWTQQDLMSDFTVPGIYSSICTWLSQWQILSPKNPGKLQELQHSLEVTGEAGLGRL